MSSTQLRQCIDCGAQTPLRKGQWRSNFRCRTCAKQRRAAIRVKVGIVHRALKSGALVKSACEICGAEKSDAHHDDYARPLDVRWLCRSHHKQHHAKFGPGKNAYAILTTLFALLAAPYVAFISFLVF